MIAMFSTRSALGLGLVIPLVLPLWAACGGDDGAGNCDPAMGDPATLVGSFEIELVGPTSGTPGRTTVVGVVKDGPTPVTIVWAEAMASGDCKLLTPRAPFCATPCGGAAACVADDVCQTYPAKQGVGTVNVTGLVHDGGTAAFDLTSVADSYQVPSSVVLAYPGFGEGSEVTVEARGSDFACGFSLTARGIGPLAITTTQPALADNTALDMAWTPPADTGAARVDVQLDISHHGGTKGKIVCDTPDDGQLSIAATLVDGLLALGAAGYPTIIVTRDAIGSAVISAGKVELVLRSQIELPIVVPGVMSCTETSECSSGQVCRDDLTCG